MTSATAPKNAAIASDPVDLRDLKIRDLSAEVARLSAQNDDIVAAAFRRQRVTAKVHEALIHLAAARTQEEFKEFAAADLPGMFDIDRVAFEDRYVRKLMLHGKIAELPLNETTVLVLTGKSNSTYTPNQGTDLLRVFHILAKGLWEKCAP
ncbi:MAG: hypothetical protein AAGJ34_13355 [Pseudomonadota bacterium]